MKMQKMDKNNGGMMDLGMKPMMIGSASAEPDDGEPEVYYPTLVVEDKPELIGMLDKVGQEFEARVKLRVSMLEHRKKKGKYGGPNCRAEFEVLSAQPMGMMKKGDDDEKADFSAIGKKKAKSEEY